MGSAARSIGVTFHPPSRQYKKTIGRRRGPDGKPRPQVFYLGTDQREAKNRAFLLMTEWDRLQNDGAAFWPEGTTGAAVAEQDSISPRKSENSRPEAERLVQPGELTIEDAARIYIGEQERRLSTKQVSAAHVRHMRYRIGRVVEVIGGRTPLMDVGRDELQRAVDHFLKRPMARRHEKDERPATRMAIPTVVGFIRAMKGMFVWLDEDEDIPWSMPKSHRRIFAIKREAMKTDEERKRETEEMVTGRIPLFEIDDLRMLYGAASGQARAWMLLALNAGFTQKELSDLRDFEVCLDVGAPYIHRKRGKTNVEMKWELWPETVEAIRRERAFENRHQRIFLTAHGKTLCGGKENGRDAVRQVWRKLRVQAGVPDALSFKYLRKTGADYMKRLDGVETSEMYLAHVEAQQMSRHYTNRDWDRMNETLWKMRDIFEPMWVSQA